MLLNTASEGISLAKKLENDSAYLYEEIVKHLNSEAATFLAFIRENRRNITQIERTYYGVITDAIEGCFCFNINDDNYFLETSIPPNINRAEALKQAIDIENRIAQFYQDAATQSQALMADIPRLFKLLFRKRSERVQMLKALLDRKG
jgi:hypothetical protein